MPGSRTLGIDGRWPALRRRAWAAAVAAALALAAVAALTGRASPPSPVTVSGSEAPRLSVLGFEENRGQAAPSVLYLSRGRDYTFYATRQGPMLALRDAAAGRDAPLSTLRLQPTGGDPAPHVTGEETLPGRVNYLRGSNPSTWQTEIPTFGRVRYEGVYPGIDLAFYDRGGELEYDVVVAPGADPSAVRLRLEGVRRVEQGVSGDLALTLEGGAEVRQHRPRAYQETARGRRDVAAAYTLDAAGDLGFTLGPYDRALPLVIDPVITYATYLGGGAQEGGLDVAVDGAGHAYTTGWTMSLDFPASGPDVGLSGARDGFVARFDPAQDGAASRVFVTYLGGSGDDVAHGVALGPDGGIYVVGETSSTDFPGTAGGYQPAKVPQLPAYYDVFLARLAADGSSVQYATYLGGSGNEEGYGVAVDAQGRAYITGRTESIDFPTKAALQHSNAGIFDVIVAKLDPSLMGAGSLVYATYMGGRADESGDAIAVNAAGEAHVTGYTNSFDVPSTPWYDGFPVVNALQGAPGGGFDAFAFRLNAAGSALVYSTYLGGPGTDNGTIYDGGIAVDAAGNTFVAASTQSASFPFALPEGSLDTTLDGWQDAFVAKLGPGGTLEAFTYLGGSYIEYGTDVAVDATGAVHVTGSTYSTDFPTTPDARAKGASADAFVTKLANDLSAVLFSTFLGGNDADFGYGIAAEAGGVSWATGDTGSADFPVERGFQSTFGGPGAGSGGRDTFLARLGRAAATVEVEQTIGVAVATGVFPPRLVELAQSIGVAAPPGVLPSRLVELAQSIGVAAVPGVLPSRLVELAQSIGVAAAPGVFPPRLVELAQSIGVAVATGMLPPRLVELAQSIGVAAPPGVLPPVSVVLAQAIGMGMVGGPVPSPLVALDMGIGVGQMVRAAGPASVSLDQTLTLGQTSGAQRGGLPAPVPAATWPYLLLLAALLSGGIAVWSFRAGVRRAPGE